jgi:DNA-binding MltR family transcriptional regulator
MEDGQLAPGPGSNDTTVREEFLAELLGGKSHRAAVIAGQSFLECAVRHALWNLMTRRDKHAKAILGADNKKGELGFSDQCRLLYALGLIGQHTLSDFHILARIRNKFGHRHLSLRFDTPEIASACDSLWSPDHPTTLPPDMEGMRAFYATIDRKDRVLWARARYAYAIYFGVHGMSAELGKRQEVYISHVTWWLK